MHLALDHLTVSDAYPWQLVDLAADHGFQGVCLFLNAMGVIPAMPAYNLIEDREALARTKAVLDHRGLSLDLVYPFTVTGRSQLQDYVPALQASADLGAKAINLLVYDRDEGRRADTVGAIVDRAKVLGLSTVVEFYPSSAVRTLADAADLVSAIGRGKLGINLDILHLYRSGGSVADIAVAQSQIGFAQLADAPRAPPSDLEFEAGRGRLNIGQGELDVAAFVQALPGDIKLSLEVPSDADIAVGEAQGVRAARAIEAMRRALPAASL